MPNRLKKFAAAAELWPQAPENSMGAMSSMGSEGAPWRPWGASGPLGADAPLLRCRNAIPRCGRTLGTCGGPRCLRWLHLVTCFVLPLAIVVAKPLSRWKVQSRHPAAHAQGDPPPRPPKRETPCVFSFLFTFLAVQGLQRPPGGRGCLGN